MSEHPSDPMIRIRGVKKSFGNRHILRGVDLDVYRAENVVVLGKSGTGKSVLTKTVIGLLQADEGTIEVLGKEVGSLSRRELDALRVRIGYSFQHSALYDSMSIAENVAFPLVMNQKGTPRAEVNDRVDAALASVGLLDSKAQMPAELSGGQQKRVGIARALILEPEVMLYDEPTAGLDPLTCGEINDLIVQVRETRHTATIVITHDLASAKHVGDRVAMLIEGKMIGGGTFDELFSMDHPQVRAFHAYNFTDQDPS
jgi:phospholipid/cholesterol/gamma-HCH transport system ATP-binding protein